MRAEQGGHVRRDSKVRNDARAREAKKGGHVDQVIEESRKNGAERRDKKHRRGKVRLRRCKVVKIRAISDPRAD